MTDFLTPGGTGRAWTLLLLLLLCQPLPGFAEVYRWTAEDGTVHYSDAKPTGDGAAAVDMPDTPRLRFRPPEEPPAPISWTEDWSSRELRVLPLAWPEAGPAGRIFYGSDCVSPQSFSWTDSPLFLNRVFPAASSLTRDVRKAVGDLGYRQKATTRAAVEQPAQGAAWLVLEGRVKQVNLELCLSDIRRGFENRNLEDLRPYNVDRHQSRVVIEWSLRDSGGESLLQGEESGYANSEAPAGSRVRLGEVTGQAAGNALRRFFSRPDVVRLLWREGGRPVRNEASREDLPILTLQEQILVWVIGIIMVMGALRVIVDRSR